MNINEQIKQEKRTEAVRKNLMGGTGKLGAIAKLLGHPVSVHGGVEINDMDDMYDLNDDNELPTYDIGPQNFLGWVWDGLSQGIHMEVRLKGWGSDPNDSRTFVYQEINVTYKGYLVYKEELGELTAYASKHPIVGEWEHLLDPLYERAKKIKIEAEDEQREIREKENVGFTKRLLNALRLQWGDE